MRYSYRSAFSGLTRVDFPIKGDLGGEYTLAAGDHHEDGHVFYVRRPPRAQGLRAPPEHTFPR